MEKNINTQQALLFSFLKKWDYKAKKNCNISYLIMVLIKMRLLILLVLSQYVLSCKEQRPYPNCHAKRQNDVFGSTHLRTP